MRNPQKTNGSGKAETKENPPAADDDDDNYSDEEIANDPDEGDDGTKGLL